MSASKKRVELNLDLDSIVREFYGIRRFLNIAAYSARNLEENVRALQSVHART